MQQKIYFNFNIFNDYLGKIIGTKCVVKSKLNVVVKNTINTYKESNRYFITISSYLGPYLYTKSYLIRFISFMIIYFNIFCLLSSFLIWIFYFSHFENIQNLPTNLNLKTKSLASNSVFTLVISH